MTTVRIAAGDLKGLDALDVDALALPLFEVRAQPRAVAGFVDWRLCGRISRLIVSGRFCGASQEALLMPGLGRCGAHRVFLLGLGKPTASSKVDFEQAVTVLADASARKLAFGFPTTAEQEMDGAGHVILVGHFLKALAKKKSAFEEVVILDPSGVLASSSKGLKQTALTAGLKWA